MEISVFYGKELAVTGSERTFSHQTNEGKSAYSIDIGSYLRNGKRVRYAPFTCKVVYSNPKYNSLYCESLEPVASPRFPQGKIMCFGIAHLKTCNYQVGDIIKQGEVLGEDWYTGLSDKSAIHTHWAFGVGKFKGLHRLGYYNYNGKLIDGIYGISCDGYIHSYDFFYIEDACEITTKKDYSAYAYPYKRVSQHPQTKEDVVKKEEEENIYKAFYDKYHDLIEKIKEV